MLRFENNQSRIGLSRAKVSNATVTLAQAALINVAEDTGLELFPDSFDEFTSRIEGVMANPEIDLAPADLIRHAEAYAARGAQAMLADGEARFRESTWFHEKVCPLWPFC